MRQRVASILSGALLATCVLGICHADDRFGALSYSRVSGAFAVVLDRPSRDAAEFDALATCARKHRDCATPVWVKNGCVAIAIGHAHGYGSGWGSTREAAEDEAMTVCRRHTTGCFLQPTACTSQ